VIIKTARKQKLHHDKQVRLDTRFNWRQSQQFELGNMSSM